MVSFLFSTYVRYPFFVDLAGSRLHRTKKNSYLMLRDIFLNNNDYCTKSIDPRPYVVVFEECTTFGFLIFMINSSVSLLSSGVNKDGSIEIISSAPSTFSLRWVIVSSFFNLSRGQLFHYEFFWSFATRCTCFALQPNKSSKK